MYIWSVKESRLASAPLRNKYPLPLTNLSRGRGYLFLRGADAIFAFWLKLLYAKHN